MGITLRNGKPITKVLSDKVTIPPEPYHRPDDWLPIPEMDGSLDEIYILNGVGLNCLNQIYFVLTVNQPATIDWGDGTTTEINTTSQTTYNHKYSYEDIPDSSWTEHNQTKQVLIYISAPRGSVKLAQLQTAYYYTNSDGVRAQYDVDSSTDIYQISADVESCEAHCSRDRHSEEPQHKNLEVFDWKGELTNTSMSYMFIACSSLQSIPQLDTSKVTDMSYMFIACYSLQSIPQLDTSNVTSMSSMFSYCSSLQSIPQLDTSKVTDMSSMFSSCYSLQSIPQLDTSKVTDMSYMFSYCSSLTNPTAYNAGAASQSSITLSNLSNSTMMTKQQIIDLINSICPNTVSGHTRTIQLGTTLQGYLANCYVKDSGTKYTVILATSDTTREAGATYYTYNKVTGEYTEYTGELEAGKNYQKLITATWNKYVICESTDEGAMLALDWTRNIKNWTVS